MRSSMFCRAGVAARALFSGVLLAFVAIAALPSSARAEGTIKVADNVYMALGQSNISSNTFMIITSEGNVIIDTSTPDVAPQHYAALRAISSAPVKYIILTHGHGDHIGGVSVWREKGTHVIGQQNEVELINYQTRLRGFLAPRDAAQAGKPAPGTGNPNPGNYAGNIPADILFDTDYTLSLGGYTFKMKSMPGETPDMLNVFIPELNMMFIGDNYYTSFPNIYTLRGTKPRWALDYINSLNAVLQVHPAILLPSHGLPVKGVGTIQATLTQYRNAIQYVHDAVVTGMDTGVDEFTLMNTIKLPPNLDVGETYGKVTWSIRGIYEGYQGWFDADQANMYPTPPKAALPDLVALAGGTANVVAKGRSLLSSGGDTLIAIHLADAALQADSTNVDAWTLRRDGLQLLFNQSTNGIERNWLQDGINKANAAIGGS